MFYYFFNCLRFLGIWIDFMILTVFLYALSFFPKPIHRWIRFNLLFQYWSASFVRALGVQLKLHQKNKNPLPKHYILIANHPSALEDIGMPTLFKAQFLAKEAVQHWWIVGRIAKTANTFFVKRDCQHSRQQAKTNLINAIQNGHNVAIYPEGGCKGRRVQLPFQQGAFDISFKTQTPIIPVFIHYEAQESFEWLKETLLQKIFSILRAPNKTANYYVFDALYPVDFHDKKALCEHAESLYLKWQSKYLE